MLVCLLVGDTFYARRSVGGPYIHIVCIRMEQIVFVSNSIPTWMPVGLLVGGGIATSPSKKMKFTKC